MALTTAIYAVSYLNGGPIASRVYAQTPNVLGINCSYGSMTDPNTLTPVKAMDNNNTLGRDCQWAGDTDGDGVLPSMSGFDPLVTDPAPLNPLAPCTTAPCGAPGGGGFIASVIINLNSTSSANGFDVSITYDPTVLNAVQINQNGLLFGGNVGCSSCTLSLAKTIDNTAGIVRVAQTLLGVSTPTGVSVTLFRIRFDVVGAGRSLLHVGGANTVTFNNGGVAQPLPHTSVDSTFGTNVIYDAISGANGNVTPLNFNASFTFSPNPPTPGSAITFTATANCGACVGALSYNWNFSTAEGAAGSTGIQSTGQVVTVTQSATLKISRVELVVHDSATPIPNNVTATKRLSLSDIITGPTTVAKSTAAGPWTSFWLGGVPPYSGLWRVCPVQSGLTHVCTTSPTSTGAISIAAGTTAQSSLLTSSNYALGGLYYTNLQITDSNPSWNGGPTSIVYTLPVNVTGTPLAYTVTVTPNPATGTAPLTVNATATLAYASTDPTADRATTFNYQFFFGDGSAPVAVTGGLSVFSLHTFSTGGTFVIKVIAVEASAPPLNMVQEQGFATVSVTGGVTPPSVTLSCPSTGTVGTAVTCTATGSNGTPPYTFAWSAPGGNPATAGNVTSFSTTYNAKGTFSVNATLTDHAGAHASKVASITISPLPLADSISGPTTGTTGTAVTFTASATGGTSPYTFSWTAVGGTPPSGTGASFSVTYSVKGTYTVNATVTDTNGAKAFKLATITISPATPLSDSVSGPTTGTAGTAVTFTATATGGTSPYTFSWSAPGGTPATGTGASFTVTYSVKGTYTVNATVTDTNGAKAFKLATITINPATPVSDTVSGPTTGTVGTAVTFTVTASGGTSPYTFSWSAPGGTPATGTGASFTVTYSVKGTYTVNATVTDNNGAHAFKTASITIAALALADSVSGPTTGTVGTAVTFTASATGGTSPYTFGWVATGGSPATGTGASFTTTYAVKGTYTVNATVTDTNGKKAFKLATITISPLALSDSVTGPTTGTAGTAVTFSATATGGTSPYTFSWAATGGSPATGTGASFTTTYNVKGTYTVNATVTDTNGAKAFKLATITISPLPLADSVAGPTTGTVGTAVTFTATATGGTTPYTFSWTAVGGTPATGTGASFTVTYSVKGTYTVNATVTDNNGAKAFKTASITISPLTLADSVAGPTTGTVGTAVTFTASATGGTSPYTFSWSAPGGTPATGTGTSFTVTYSVKGTYTVNATVTDTNAKHASSVATITISPLALADSVSGPTTGTVGTAVTFTATATGGTSPYTFSWTATGGTPATGTGASFTVTYSVKGTYTVNATVTDNNAKKAFKLATITISPLALADSISGPTTGTAGTAVTFTATATGGTSPYTFSWAATGGTPATGTGASFTVTYSVKGTYTVNATVTDTNGAKAFKLATITISPLPLADSVSGPTTGTAGTAVTFTATATGGTSPYTFSWAATGGTPATGTGASFTVTYSVKGTYTVNATVTDNNGAKAFKLATITINPLPLADSVAGPTTGTAGTAVTFTASATGGTTPYTFSWTATGGNPATGTGASFTTTYAVKGTYTVNATVTDNNGVKAFKLATITISPVALSDSVSGPTTGTVGTAVTFTATASGGTSPYTFSWSAPGGTPATGTGASFTVTYSVKGTYTVNATVTDNNGAHASKTASITIAALALADSVSGPTTGTVGTAVTFTATATGGTSPYTFSWSAVGGTPATGTGASFSVTYSVKGTYTVNATVTDTNGKHASAVASITISPLALADSVAGPTTGTVGTAVTFTATATGGTSPYTFSWSAPGGTPATGTGASFTVTYSVKGTYTVNATVTDTNGKHASKTASITISPLALADSIAGPTTGTAGTAVTFTASATGGTSPYAFSWSAPGGTPATGTGASFTVTYSVKGTYTVNATVTDNNGAHASKTASITISPVALAVSISGPTTGTAGTAVTFTATATGGTSPYTFSWSAPGGTPATGTGASFTVTYSVKGTYTVNATATDNNAAHASKTASITISPQTLTDSISGPTTGTPGTAVTFTATATGGTSPYTFSWSAPGGSPTTGTGASFTVTYATKGTFTVNATVTDNNGAHASKTATIAISATPLSDSVSGPTTGTVGTAVTFTASATGGTAPYTFSWTATGGNPATGTGASFTTTYGVKGTYTVNATVTDNNGAHAFKAVTITISPLALSDSITGPTTGTAGTAVTFTVSATGGTSPYTFSWSAPGGTPATGTGASFTVTYSVKGTYTVNATVTDNNGAHASKTASITIAAVALADSIAGPTTGTAGTAVTFTATATGGTSPYTFSWSAPGGTPATGTGASFTVTYSVKGTYTVNATVTDTNGKHASKTASITIAALALADSISGPTTGSVGTAVTFTATATGGTSPYTFSWSAPGGNPATGTGASFTTTYAVKGTYTVNATVTDTNGAHASKTASITISSTPVVVTVSGPTTGTVGTAVTFTASATGGTSPYTFTWSAPGGTPTTGSGASFTVTYSVKGTYTVNATATDNNGAHAFKTASITISPLAFTVSVVGPTSGTVGTAVTFTASGTGGTSPYTFSWSAPGGTPATGTGASFTVTYSAKGTFSVNATGTDTNGAHASKVVQIVISPLPLAVSVSGPSSGTVGTAVTFTASATGGTAPYTFSWSAPGGTPATGTGASFTVSYSVKGSYTVNATVTDNNGAHASKTASISISSTPPVVSIAGPTTGTAGTAVTFTASATGGTSPYTFSWSAPGGNPATGTGASFTTTYAVKGTYTVNATVTDNNGAKAFKLATITISPVALSDSIAGPTTGTVGTAVTFTASATGGTAPYTFSWSAPGGTPATGTGTSFTVSYSVKGTYTLNATVTDNNGAHASKTASITIAALALADSVSGPASGTVGTAVTFTATATGGTSPYTFSWSAPGGTPATGTGASFTVSYAVKGTYTVNATVTDTNGKHASKTASISISSTPPAVTISGPTTGTAGTAVTFTATATGGTSPYTFTWSAPGGNPTTGTGASFTTTYAVKGTYTVNATVTDNNGAKAFKLATITISPVALAVTVSGPTSGTAGTAVTFTASATGGTAPYTFSWSAPGGTPATGTGASFTVTYSVKGTYTVNATATDNNGAHASKTASITIAAQPLTASFTASANPTVGTPVTFTATVTGGTTPYSFSWNFGDGSAIGTGNPVSHTYTSKGTKSVSLTVTDNNGALAPASLSITVAPTALADSISGPTTGTAGTAVTFTATATGGTSPYTFSWTATGGNPATGTGASFTTTYAVKGTYTVNATVTDNNGAHASKIATITISSTPPAVTVSGPTSGTVGTAVTFTASATGGTSPYTFSWTATGGNPATGTGASFTTTYAVKGTYTVNATVTDNNGAHASKTATITIAPSQFLLTIAGPTSGTVGTAVTFTGSVTGGTSPYSAISWGAPGGTPATGTGSSFTVTYNVKGTYTVNATVTDNNGAKTFKTATITINPTALTSDFTASPTTISPGTPETFTATTSGGTSPYTYAWNFGDGSTGTGNPVQHTYATSGSFSVRENVTDNNGVKFTITHTVGGVLTVSISCNPTTVAVGATVNCTSSVSGGTSPYTYAWSATGGTPSSGTAATFSTSYSAKGSFSISLTVTDSATPTHNIQVSNTVTITVTPLALVASVSGPAVGTVGTPVTFTASATGGTAPYTFSWSAPGMSPATGTGSSFTTSCTVKGTFTVTVTATDNNGKTAPASATINCGGSVLTASVSGPATGVTGTAVTFTATATGGTTPYTFSWSAPGGTPATGTGASFTVSYAVKGTYTVTLTVTDNNGATAQATHSITISAGTPLAVSITCPATGTVGTAVNCSASASGGTSPYTFSWTATGGSPASGTGSSFSTTYSTKGTYTISVTATDNNGARATNSASVSIAALTLNVSFTVSSNPTVGSPVTFTATATGGTSPYSFAWNFGDGSTLMNGATVTHTYTAKGTYTVSVTVTDNNAKTANTSQPVTVAPQLLTTSFTYSPTSPTAQSPVTFTASASGGTGPYSFSWTFGDSSTGTGSPVMHTYAGPGAFTVTLTTTDNNGKTATSTQTVNVGPATLVVTISCSPTTVTVGQSVACTASSTGGTPPVTFSWSAPGGSPATGTGSSFTTMYSTKGSYTITVTGTDSSSPAKTSPASQTIAVSPLALATSFTFSPSAPSVGQSVTFTASATGGTAPYSFSWNFGDSSTGTGSPVSHTFTAKGSYMVTEMVTDQNGKTATSSQMVTVTPNALTADFTFSPTSPSINQTVSFTSTVTGGTTPYTYSWNFGDSSTSTSANPTHAYAAAGNYTVVLTVTDANAKTASATHVVTVSNVARQLTADFGPTNTIVGTTNFVAVISGGTSPYLCSWSFGDGSANVSPSCSPAHTYIATGTYTVTLNVTDSASHTATATHAVTVQAAPTISYTYSHKVAAGGTQTFKITVNNPTTFTVQVNVTLDFFDQFTGTPIKEFFGSVTVGPGGSQVLTFTYTSSTPRHIAFTISGFYGATIPVGAGTSMNTTVTGNVTSFTPASTGNFKFK